MASHFEHLSQPTEPHTEYHSLVTAGNTQPLSRVPTAPRTEGQSLVTTHNTEPLSRAPAPQSADRMSVPMAGMEPLNRVPAIRT